MTPKSLLAAIALPASVVSRKSTLPIINCLHIADGRVTGTDLERQASAAVDLDLRCCVPADRLLAALKALPADCELRLDMDDKRLRVRGGRSKFMIPTLPVDDYPLQEWVEPDVVIEEPQELAAAIRTVGPAMAVHDVRQYLVGICPQNGGINASNGFWMARHDSDALPNDIIIPRASVPMLLASLDEETVRYGVNDRGLHIAANGYRLSTKLVEGRFPDCHRYWSKKFARTWTVSREEFVASVESVDGGRAKGSYSCAILRVSGGMLSLEYQNLSDEAQAQVACDGPAYETALDLRFLLPAAKTLAGETLTLASDGGATDPIGMTGDNPAQRVVIMPVRV